ncbi:MAG: hypothetical protein VXA56_15340, partial [Deltaproteobacteria bacterium]
IVNIEEYSLFFLLKLFSISSVFKGAGVTSSGQLVYQGFSLQTSLLKHSYIEKVSKVSWSAGSIMNQLACLNWNETFFCGHFFFGET